jgi:uncharacterized protein
MKTKPLTFLLALTFLFLSTSSCSDDLQDANDAYVRKDYKEAHKLYSLLAEQENSNAQDQLGWMYDQGEGVPQDHKESVKWYRLAAEQGFSQAQFKLGYAYENGKGVKQDYVLAYMWLYIAGSNGDNNAVENIKIVENEMTPQQIEKAQEMARNWKSKKK